MDASIVNTPHAPHGSIKIEVCDDWKDPRSESAQTEEQAYQYSFKSY